QSHPIRRVGYTAVCPSEDSAICLRYRSPTKVYDADVSPMPVSPSDDIPALVPTRLLARLTARQMTRQRDYLRERFRCLSMVCAGRGGQLASQTNEEYGSLPAEAPGPSATV